MIGRLFKRGQHEYRVLHLLHTEPSDTQYFSLVRHDITQQHDVSRIDRHSVRLHGMLNLVVNCLSSSFDTEHLAGFHDVICLCPGTNDTYYQQCKTFCRMSVLTLGTHDLGKTVSCNEQFKLFAILLILIDHTTRTLRQAFDLNRWQSPLELLESFINSIILEAFSRLEFGTRLLGLGRIVNVDSDS